jgi:hypothetical protein
MGYVKSSEPSLALETIGSGRSQASGMPLRRYKEGATFTEMDEFEKATP